MSTRDVSLMGVNPGCSGSRHWRKAVGRKMNPAPPGDSTVNVDAKRLLMKRGVHYKSS